MENRIEYIERFINGELSDKEMREFESRRSADREFDYEVRLYQKAHEVIKMQTRNRMKERLDNIGRQQLSGEMTDTFVRVHLLRKYWLQIAASIIVLSGLTYLAFNRISGPEQMSTMAALYENHYEKPGIEQVITRGSNGGSMDLLWNSALNKYNSSDYSNAVNDFRNVLNNEEFKQKSAASFYTAICYLNLQSPDSAVYYLNNISPSSSFSDEAAWYLGLSYLQAGNNEKALNAFNEITESRGHFKKKEAKQIARKLQKLRETD